MLKNLGKKFFTIYTDFFQFFGDLFFNLCYYHDFQMTSNKDTDQTEQVLRLYE